MRALHVAAGFDRFLVRFAIANPTLTRVADSYARLLAPTSTFRKKLVLLLAILESSASSQRFLEHVDGGGKLWLGVAALANGGIFAVSLLLGAVVLFPAQLALGFGSTPVEN
ncbi:MAG TPA: hypothetical protein VGQ71_02655 [Terriglobales bacterium]|nr:hypothetical protein [Terriglobales bacterium]